MKENKFLKVISIILNILGVICLVFFGALFISHNTTVPNPDAMLPTQRWDEAGMALTVGLLPLIIANVMGCLFVKLKSDKLRFLFFIPSVVCIVLVAVYWVISF